MQCDSWWIIVVGQSWSSRYEDLTQAWSEVNSHHFWNDLSQMDCISPDKLCVLFNSQLLKDDRTLSDYNIANDRLDLVSGGETISLHATLATPQLRWKIWSQIRYGIAKVEQRLCYGAKQLDDQKLSLSTAFMVDALNLLGRLSGGNPGKSTYTPLHPAHSYIRSVLNTDGIEASSIAWPLLEERLV